MRDNRGMSWRGKEAIYGNLQNVWVVYSGNLNSIDYKANVSVYLFSLSCSCCSTKITCFKFCFRPSKNLYLLLSWQSPRNLGSFYCIEVAVGGMISPYSEDCCCRLLPLVVVSYIIDFFITRRWKRPTSYTRLPWLARMYIKVSWHVMLSDFGISERRTTSKSPKMS